MKSIFYDEMFECNVYPCVPGKATARDICPNEASQDTTHLLPRKTFGVPDHARGRFMRERREVYRRMSTSAISTQT